MSMVGFEALERSGLLERLAEDQQTEREKERATLLEELARVRQDDEKAGLEAHHELEKAEQAVDRLEAELRRARQHAAAVAARFAVLGLREAKIIGRLRKLADSRIAAARAELNELHELARRGFTVVNSFERAGLFGGKRPVSVSNHNEVDDSLTEIRAGLKRLDELEVAARPADLDKVLAEILGVARARVRRPAAAGGAPCLQ